MLAYARSQILDGLPERLTPATSEPVERVFQLASIVSPATMLTRKTPLLLMTATYAEESRSMARPLRSLGFMLLIVSSMVAVESGPRIRCVRVFRAA
jgi:hypothetical protein